jgi:hypothetical protein
MDRDALQSQSTTPNSHKEVYWEHHSGLEVVTPPHAFGVAPAQNGCYYAPYPPQAQYGQQQQEQRIWGMRRTTFILLIVLIIVVIIAAVGGGLGGSMAVNNASTQCLA